MYICVRGNKLASVSNIWPLDMAAVLRVWYIWLFMLSIKSWMLENLLRTYYTYFIQYVTLNYNHIEYQSFTCWYILGFFYFTVICIPIKSHRSNQTRSTTLQRFIGCQYSSYLFSPFYELQYMYIYTLCCFKELFRQNIEIPRQNKRICIILITHTSTV
jgi:hypothetical protein